MFVDCELILWSMCQQEDLLLGGEDPLDMLGELLPPAKVIPAGKVLALPTLILGL